MQSHAAPTRVPIPQRRPERRPEGLGTENSVAAAAVESEGVTSDSGFLDALESEPKAPVFEGFENDRFQQHDERIEALVKEFNADKAAFIGANPEQVEGMADLDAAMVKSWIIQETGGGGKPWQIDPSQANNPGDWADSKTSLGLEKPAKRNTGDADTNLRAGIALLARKGFSRSGKAPSELQGGQTWGGWNKALTDYNGNGKRMGDGRKHKEHYAERIQSRAQNPDVRHRIPLGRKP